MLAKFNEKAQKAIVDAESIAFDLGHSHIGSEHLLLSILKIKECSFSQAMKKCHVDEDNIKLDIVRLFGKKDIQPFYIEYSDVVKKILDDATSMSEKNKESKVSLDMVCLALLKQKECVAITLLKNYDVPYEAIENQLNKKTKSKNNFSLGKCSDFASVIKPTKKKIILERDEEVKQLLIGLSCKDKPNILLTGKAGVGKTAVVEELARVLSVSPIKNLEGYLIVSLDSLSAVAGTRYRGDFEEKINKLMKQITNKKVILFIDEGHILSSLGACENSTSLSELLKPFLTKDNFRFIIATTEDEYQKFISENVAFARRFRKIHIKEPKKEKVARMIQAKVQEYQRYHNVQINQSQIQEVIDLVQSIPDRYYPDKALDVIDYSMACCAINNLKEFDTNYAKKYIEGMNL